MSYKTAFAKSAICSITNQTWQLIDEQARLLRGPAPGPQFSTPTAVSGTTIQDG